jgi:predicted TIM-barrel fold metal-dependent hydrolase
MKSAIKTAWEHGGADSQSRRDKSTAQAQEMNIYVGCEAAEKSLPRVAQFLGADHIGFPTDFPYPFTFERFVEEVRGFVERKDLPPDLSRKILWDNPKRLYGI